MLKNSLIGSPLKTHFELPDLNPIFEEESGQQMQFPLFVSQTAFDAQNKLAKDFENLISLGDKNKAFAYINKLRFQLSQNESILEEESAQEQSLLSTVIVSDAFCFACLGSLPNQMTVKEPIKLLKTDIPRAVVLTGEDLETAMENIRNGIRFEEHDPLSTGGSSGSSGGSVIDPPSDDIADTSLPESPDDAEVEDVKSKPASFGSSDTTDYKKTFFEENPETKGEVVVHHAVEQQVMTRYKNLVSESEMHSLENLRGIPKELNSDVHLSKIRKSWNRFYKKHPKPTQQELLDHATKIDDQFGHLFKPPVR